MTTLDFATRVLAPEIMDEQTHPYEEFQACLVDLARMNRLTLAYRPTLAFLDRLVPRFPHGRPLEIVDVGCGYGDLLREIDAWATRRGVEVSLTGVDLSPWSRRAAVHATAPDRPIRWVTADALQYAPPAGIDVVVSSQFTHHLSDAQVVQFVEWMERTARLAWHVSDLHRHRIPYDLFRTLTSVTKFHPWISHDGCVSIGRAFDRADWCRLVEAAGLDASAVRIEWWVPFRLSVGRRRPRVG